MSQEMDISWQVLRGIARRWGGEHAELAEATPLHGGCINTTIALTLADHRRAVLKITAHRVDRSYVNEAAQLRMMGRIGLPVPGVLDVRIGSLEEPFSYLLMEYVDGVNLNDARRHCSPAQYDQIQCHLAELLLRLHDNTCERYRRVHGDCPGFDTWHSFYREVFDPIWGEMSAATSIPIKSRKIIGKVHDRLDRLLDHDDVPRLVHWDVWATNVLAHQDERGQWRVSALLDPNCKFAHAEAEIAYMELFHTATPVFLKAYQQGRKLPAEYHAVRKPIYHMYSLLNHALLFGEGYTKPLLAAVERAGALV